MDGGFLKGIETTISLLVVSFWIAVISILALEFLGIKYIVNKNKPKIIESKTLIQPGN